MAVLNTLTFFAVAGCVWFAGALDVKREEMLERLLNYDANKPEAPPDLPPMPKHYPRPPPEPKFPFPPPMPKGCFMDGLMHKPSRERFTAMKCSALCRCRGPGAIFCVSLCPPSWPPQCKPNEKLVYRDVPAWKTGKCTCRRAYCEEKDDLLEARSIESELRKLL